MAAFASGGDRSVYNDMASVRNGNCLVLFQDEGLYTYKVCRISELGKGSYQHGVLACSVQYCKICILELCYWFYSSDNRGIHA